MKRFQKYEDVQPTWLIQLAQSLPPDTYVSIDWGYHVYKVLKNEQWRIDIKVDYNDIYLK